MWASKASYVTSVTPEITTKQQQHTSNNSLLASLLNNIYAKPLKHVVFYLAGLAAAGTSILFITGVNVNAWCECCVAIGGRWLDPCFKREWQSLAVFCGVTVAHGLLMMINPRQLLTGWMCFTAALVRSSHGVGAGCPRRPLHHFLMWKGGKWGWGHTGEKKNASISLNDLLMQLACGVLFLHFPEVITGSQLTLK